jgi:uncharacterized protein (TIGR00299 family) protein
MKLLYYDCFAGISGDMNLAALLDLGVAPDMLRQGLAGLGLPGYELRISQGTRSGIAGTRVDVVSTAPQQHHRRLADIEAIIRVGNLSDRVKALSLAVFRKLARAEAAVHGAMVDEVHFHEVGAVDAIVDIVGAALCLEALEVDRVLCSPVELGGGFVKCAHGLLPVPGPATAALLEGVPVKLGAARVETTTPTGAALLATFVDEFVDRVEFTVQATGHGLGHREIEIPNLLRVFLGDQSRCGVEHFGRETALKILECNIDDMNPELYEHVMDRLFAAGARDVYLTPVIAKKSRPGTLVNVLCDNAVERAMLEILFTETTTLGVRALPVARTALKREMATITTRFGDLRVKTAGYGDRAVNWKPEYEDCRRLALSRGVPLKSVYDAVVQAVLGRTEVGPVWADDGLPERK